MRAWSTRANGGGIWAPGGICPIMAARSSIATGNTKGASGLGRRRGGHSSRLPISSPRPIKEGFLRADGLESSSTTATLDLGGTNPLVPGFDVTDPSGITRVVLALGKDGKAYLLDRANLGGLGGALAVESVAGERDPHRARGLSGLRRQLWSPSRVRERIVQGRAGGPTSVRVQGAKISNPPSARLAAARRSCPATVLATESSRPPPVLRFGRRRKLIGASALGIETPSGRRRPALQRWRGQRIRRAPPSVKPVDGGSEGRAAAERVFREMVSCRFPNGATECTHKEHGRAPTACQ